MDNASAKAIAQNEMNKLRQEPYEDLLKRTKAPEHKTVKGPDGKEWGVEVNVFHDDGHRGESLRVMVAVDDGSMKAFSTPFTDSTIIGPNGEL